MREKHSSHRAVRTWLAQTTAQANAGPFQAQVEDIAHLDVENQATNLRSAVLHRHIDAHRQAVEDVTKRRKQKRNSSETSLLDIAPALSSVHRNKQGSSAAGPSAKRQKCSKTKDKTPSRSDSVSPSSDDLSDQAFRRKARRKTREDKYELKEAKKTWRELGEKRKPLNKKHKRKEKTGSTLLHNFKASNVAPDRLTVS